MICFLKGTEYHDSCQEILNKSAVFCANFCHIEVANYILSVDLYETEQSFLFSE